MKLLHCKGRRKNGKEHIYNQKHELVNKGFAFKLLIWEMKKKIHTEYYHIRLEIVLKIPP